MSMQDPIADFLTRLRNAQKSGHAQLRMPHSKVKSAICQVLQQEGYIEGYSVGEGAKQELQVQLKYMDGVPVIEEIHRVSRPGRRVYRAQSDLPSVRGGLGVAVVSTSQGLMTDREARRRGIGGEVLCTVF